MAQLLRTACYDWHVAHGGRMVEFGGWEMPVQYSSIVPEHQAVRQAAGLFDIGHMGRLKFTGPDAVRFLDHIVTNHVAPLQVGQICYALVTNEQAGVLDDVLVYRFPDHHLLVVNASNRLKILDWIERQRAGFQFELADLTLSHGMLALQGPLSVRLLQPLVDVPLSSLAYYTGASATIGGEPAIVSRTGYTGEDGFEVITAAEFSLWLCDTLLQQGHGQGLLPCGLGCRDTLRLEAAMPLYGHELDEQIDPYTAGLGMFVKLDAKPCIGHEALKQARDNTQRAKRVGLQLAGKRIAREGTPVLSGDRVVGRVTSGTYSPTLQQSIAMAYVAADCAALGTPLTAEIRGQREPAQVVRLPFYKRPRTS